MEREDEGCSTGEIEITPKMIAAGCEVLWDSDYGRDPAIRSESVVVNIIWESLKAAGFSPKMISDHYLEP